MTARTIAVSSANQPNVFEQREIDAFTKESQSLNRTIQLNNLRSQAGISTGSTGVSNPSSPSSSGSNLSTNFDGNGSLQNVFTSLGNIAESKANNDQRRFREDLPFQSRIYQDFDTEAAGRTEGIDTRAREQNSNLTKDRMRLQSTQNMAEETNRGKVQVNTTGQTRDADLKRALSVLPRK
jgi:hypothetical protein